MNPQRLALNLAIGLAFTGLLACGSLLIEDVPGSKIPDRRLYVNDGAPNDSLPKAIAGEGVKFILQPAKPYLFSVTTARSSDFLDIFFLKDGKTSLFRRVSPAHDGERQTFSFTSSLATADFFTAKLVPQGEAANPSAFTAVNLGSQRDSAARTLEVRMVFVNALKNLGSGPAKANFAASFFAEMNKVFKPYGITIAGSFEIVNPEALPMVFEFSDSYVALPGTRVANHAHLYLVDSIFVQGENGPRGDILGFAPREVVDISEHRESRVVLANRATIPRLAVTAAHELGHFFGLRHSVSTFFDMSQDDDYSNSEDGFADTRFCRIDQAFAKGAAGDISLPEAGPPSASDGMGDPSRLGAYCFRVADNSCTNRNCDLVNLMHPVECSLEQTVLSKAQVDFLKSNIALYQQ